VDANEIIAKLAVEFLEDARDRLERMESMLNDTAESAGVSSEALQDFKRELHTLKGQAGSFGFSSVSMIAHHLEDTLDGVEPSQPDLRPTVNRYIDAMESIIGQGQEPDQSVLQETLRALPTLRAEADADVLILIVSASRAITKKLRGEVEAQGYRSVTLSDPFEAFRFVASSRPECVVCSATLSGISGFDLIHGLASMPNLRDVQTMLVTSFDRDHPDIAALPDSVPVIELGPKMSDQFAQALAQLGLKTSTHSAATG